MEKGERSEVGARSFVRPKIPLRLNGRGKTEEGGKGVRSSPSAARKDQVRSKWDKCRRRRRNGRSLNFATPSVKGRKVGFAQKGVLYCARRTCVSEQRKRACNKSSLSEVSFKQESLPTPSLRRAIDTRRRGKKQHLSFSPFEDGTCSRLAWSPFLCGFLYLCQTVVRRFCLQKNKKIRGYALIIHHPSLIEVQHGNKNVKRNRSSLFIHGW